MNRNDTMKQIFQTAHRLRLVTAATVSVAVCLSLAVGGCGGGKQDGGSATSNAASVATRGKGTLTLQVKWPEIKPGDTRLVPEITKSIRVTITQENQPVVIQKATLFTGAASTTPVDVTPPSNIITINRPAGEIVPQSTVQLELPAGNQYRATVTAFSEEDGGGAAVATDSQANNPAIIVTPFVITAGANGDLVFDLQSTITGLEMAGNGPIDSTAPSTTAVTKTIVRDAGTTEPLVITAKNGAALIPLTSGKVSWTVSAAPGALPNPETRASVSPNPASSTTALWLKSTYVAGAPKPITVTATDTESGKAVSTVVNIKPVLIVNADPKDTAPGAPVAGRTRDTPPADVLQPRFDLKYANDIGDAGIVVTLQQQTTPNVFADVVPPATITLNNFTNINDGSGIIGKSYGVSLSAPNPVNTQTYRLHAVAADTALTFADSGTFTVPGIVVQDIAATVGDMIAGDNSPVNLLTANVQNATVASLSWAWTRTPTAFGTFTPNVPNPNQAQFTPPTDVAVETPVTVTTVVTKPAVPTPLAVATKTFTFAVRPYTLRLNNLTPPNTTLFVSAGSEVVPGLIDAGALKADNTIILLSPAYTQTVIADNGNIVANGTTFDYTAPAAPTSAGTTVNVAATAKNAGADVKARAASFVVRLADIAAPITADSTQTVANGTTFQFNVAGGNINTGYTASWSPSSGAPGNLNTTSGLYTFNSTNLPSAPTVVTITLSLSKTGLPVATKTFQFTVKQ